jgi:hypothetical protein
MAHILCWQCLMACSCTGGVTHAAVASAAKHAAAIQAASDAIRALMLLLLPLLLSRLVQEHAFCWGTQEGCRLGEGSGLVLRHRHLAPTFCLPQGLWWHNGIMANTAGSSSGTVGHAHAAVQPTAKQVEA